MIDSAIVRQTKQTIEIIFAIWKHNKRKKTSGKYLIKFRFLNIVQETSLGGYFFSATCSFSATRRRLRPLKQLHNLHNRIPT